MRGMVASLVVVAACARAPSTPRPPRLTAAAMHDGDAIARADLPRWTRVATRDYRQEVLVSVRDDLAGMGFEGRGIVAVRPGRALRMILLGPGGTTAMDVWIAGSAFRVAIPALDRVVRGDRSTPRSAVRGMPVAMLSRWLMAPFGGEFVAAHAGRVDDEGEVRHDAAGSFVVWTRRDDVFEARARLVGSAGGGIEGRAWWFEDHALVATIVGEEIAVGDAVVPASAIEQSFDPPMTVRVQATSTTLVDETAPLPEATFADPGP